jgi:hypothetical protein
MMDGFIHWPNPNLLVSTTCDEVLSWMIEIWMKNRFVSDSHCNIVFYNAPKKLQGMTNNVGLAFSVGDTTHQSTISIEQDN